jgi:hypothetical protein
MSISTQQYILAILFLIYFICTLIFAIKFKKTPTIFTPKQKQFHSIMIWVIPFLWIILLKSLLKPTPGSHHYPRKKGDDGFYESGAGSWGDSDSGGHH